MDTVWVFGDQLDFQIGALATIRPGSARVLMIESASKLTAAPWHVQRAHFLITSMRRFASEVAASGFEVDYRQTATFAEGLADHRAEFRPGRIVATEPNSHRARSLALREGVVLVRSNQFLCHYDDFAVWARSRKHLRLEDFYRRQRVQLDYLMDDGGPEGGRWNFDEENRRPPPRSGPYPWPSVLTEPLDTLDHDVVAGLPPNCTGSPPSRFPSGPSPPRTGGSSLPETPSAARRSKVPSSRDWRRPIGSIAGTDRSGRARRRVGGRTYRMLAPGAADPASGAWMLTS